MNMAHLLHIIPSWFLGLNTCFELLFFILTLVIALYAFKIYRISDQRESRNFASAFLFLSVSYIVLVIINYLFLSIISGNLMSLEIDDLLGLKNIAIFAYMAFFILGFVTLFYTTLKIRNIRIYSVLLLLSAILITLSSDKSLAIYLLSSIFLILVGYHYFREYFRLKNKNTLFVAIGILFIFISNILMGFVGSYILPDLYVSSRIFETIGYAFIITSLIKVLKNGKKKK